MHGRKRQYFADLRAFPDGVAQRAIDLTPIAHQTDCQFGFGRIGKIDERNPSLEDLEFRVVGGADGRLARLRRARREVLPAR